MAMASAVLAPEIGPQTLKETRWGGSRLASLRGGAQWAGRRVGESWEFSTLEDRPSRARGRDLKQVLGTSLPFLIKLIDTAAWLSVQVHPDDDPHHGTSGKEEAWIVLDADPDARVLAGLRPGVSLQALRAATEVALEDPQQYAHLFECLRSIPVQRGSVVLVPAGTLHTIGPGILLAEIQQPVDSTYRLFDYGSERPLHPERALATIRPDARPRIWHPSQTPEPLAGKHLDLRVVAEGQHRLEPSGLPAVVVPVAGHARLRHHGETMALTRGDLRLCVQGPIVLEVEPGGLVVLGFVCR